MYYFHFVLTLASRVLCSGWLTETERMCGLFCYTEWHRASICAACSKRAMATVANEPTDGVFFFFGVEANGVRNIIISFGAKEPWVLLWCSPNQIWIYLFPSRASRSYGCVCVCVSDVFIYFFFLLFSFNVRHGKWEKQNNMAHGTWSGATPAILL